MHATVKQKIWRIIFETDTPAGKFFDVVLIGAILLSVVAVMLESVGAIREAYGREFLIAEWIFTIFFTIEYILRIYVSERRKDYIFSFYGVIDLLAILPTYLSVFFFGAQSLLLIRSFRLLRIFRVFKLTHYLNQANIIGTALRASYQKIIVFLVGVLATVFTTGAVMYLIEGPENGFTSIPTSVYWAIVTMTTVGYGDIAPQTVPGQMLASLLMIAGYGVLAVPTGIVSVEMAKAHNVNLTGQTRICGHCQTQIFQSDAKYCRICGKPLSANQLES